MHSLVHSSRTLLSHTPLTHSSYTLSLLHSLSHTLSLVHSLMHSLLHSLSYTLSYTLSHTLSLLHSISHTPLIHSSHALSHTLLSYTPLTHSSRTLLSYTPLKGESYSGRLFCQCPRRRAGALFAGGTARGGHGVGRGLCLKFKIFRTAPIQHHQHGQPTRNANTGCACNSNHT